MKRRNLYRRIVLSVLLAANAATSAAIREDDPDVVTRKLFDAFNHHDMATLSQLYSDDAEITSPDHSRPLHGPEGVRAIYIPLFTRFPDLTDHLVSMTVQDNRVAVEFISTGCKATGKECFSLPIATFLTMRHGRIVRDASYFNVAVP